MNRLFIYLTQWNALAESEKSFARGRWADDPRTSLAFLISVRAMRKRSFINARDLERILPPAF
jgi:hypothetical protein